MDNMAIRTQSLTHDFDRVRAVDGLSLEVPTGIIFGFLGPNGAGKTTTIRLLLGLLEPTLGQAEVLGSDIATHADQVRGKVGVLLEKDGLYLRLSAWDNLDFYGEINHLGRLERSNRIHQLLKHLGLWEYREKAVSTFSKGMRQKLALARALLHKPLLLFLDEPTSGLDVLGAVALRDDLTTLARQEGVTVFLTTHNLAEAEKVCDQVAVIYKGRMVAEGTPNAIVAKAHQPCVEVIGHNITDHAIAALEKLESVKQVIKSSQGLTIFIKQLGNTAELVNLLVRHGAGVEEVHKVNPGLEEVFVTLMKEQEK